MWRSSCCPFLKPTRSLVLGFRVRLVHRRKKEDLERGSMGFVLVRVPKIKDVFSNVEKLVHCTLERPNLNLRSIQLHPCFRISASVLGRRCWFALVFEGVFCRKDTVTVRGQEQK